LSLFKKATQKLLSLGAWGGGGITPHAPVSKSFFAAFFQKSSA
jgi:hypothetical protein